MKSNNKFHEGYRNTITLKENEILLYGIHSCIEYLKTGKPAKIFVSEKSKEKILLLFSRNSINRNNINYIPSEVLGKFCHGGNHQGILIIKTITYSTEQDIIKNYKKILVLDGMKDPTNLGNIIRSAAVFGYGIVIQKSGSVGITPIVSKIAAGGLEYIDICYVSNIKNFLNKIIKNNTFMIVALTEYAEKNIFETSNHEYICLIVGSENEGIRKTVLEMCDTLVKIPESNSKFKTLNAATAAAIGMCFFCK